MSSNNPKYIVDTVIQPSPYQNCIREPAYFVSPNGSDKDSGSFEKPWRSLEKACASLKEGDKLYLREGIYNETIDMQVSSVSISNYPEERAIISGKNLQSEKRILSLLTIKDQAHIYISGLEFKDLESHRNKQMIIAIFIHGSSHNIHLSHNKISNIRSLSQEGDAHGIAVYGTDSTQPIKQITISHNHLHNLKLGSSEALAINGNVEYFVLNHNRIHDCDNIGIDAIGFEGKCSNSDLDFARHGVIRRNLIYNIDTQSNSSYDFERNAAGIYIDGGSDISIHDNIVHHSNIGVELASEHPNRSTELVRLEHNLLYHNHTAGLALGGYDKQRGKTQKCHIKHNHLIENDSDLNGNGELWLQNFVENNTISHNTLRSNQQELFISSYSRNCIHNEINFNQFHTANKTTNSKSNGHWVWQGKNYPNLKAYQRASHHDSDSELCPYEDMSATLI